MTSTLVDKDDDWTLVKGGLDEMKIFNDQAWTKVASMKTPRSHFATASLDGKLYAIGGSRTGKDVEMYDPSTNKWTYVASMNISRSRLGATSLDGKLYAIGGNAGFTNTENTAEMYDPSTNKWTKVASMNTKRMDLKATSLNGKLYAIGGHTLGYGRQHGCGEGCEQFLNSVEIYDPSTDKWTYVASMNTRRHSLAATSLNGKLYAIGGLDYKNERVNSKTFLNSVEMYDPSTNKWTYVASLINNICGHGTASLNGKLYVIGGYDEEKRRRLDSVKMYDPSTDKWTNVSSMNTRRDSVAATSLNGKLYAIGGICESDRTSITNPCGSSTTTLNSVEVFDDQSWITIT